MKNERGFSLIELLIVVAIIGIIAAIAIQNFASSRIAANEAAAIGNLRTLCTAQITYAPTMGNGSYGSGWASLVDANLIDDAWSSGVRSGYTYTAPDGGGNTFTFTASPETADVTGRRTFFVDQTGVIRLNDASGAVVGSSSGGGGS